MSDNEVLDVRLSPQATELLRDVRALSDAPIEFRYGDETEIGSGQQGLAASRTQRDGSAEVVLPQDFDEFALAHELLHVALKRRGIPQVIAQA